MNEVFGKKPVTSREFPVVLMSACGTLLHFSPDWETFCRLRLHATGHDRSESDCTQASLEATRHLVSAVEENNLKQSPQREWLEKFLSVLHFSQNEISKIQTDIFDHLATDLKIVISQSVIDLCTALQDRGYRLGIVSNWQGPLTEILRAQGVLEFFDAVITSHDIGFSKPSSEIFKAALEDLDEPVSKSIFLGDTFATDIIGAQRAGLKSILYDPQMKQLRALAPEDVSKKVVNLETLRHNRRLEGVKVVSKLSEVLEFLV